MSIVGIIAEFNPFHNGHAYFINTVKNSFDGVICVLSGNFVQRGEPALFNKYSRTAAALNNGVDLVIENPVGYSMSGAQNFAFGAVSLLKNCGIADNIVFGSESTDISLFKSVADYMNSSQFSNSLKVELAKGVTFAAAREKVINRKFLDKPLNLKDGNNILGLEYINAAALLNYNVQFNSVLRKGANHDSNSISDGFCSSSYIRDCIISGNYKAFNNFVPQSLYKEYITEEYADIKQIEKAIIFSLRKLNIDEYNKLPDISEGIEKRLFNAVKNASTLEELYENVKTKRYTLARIRRLVLNAAIGIDNSFIKQEVPYIHVLGMTHKGEKMLKEIAKKTALPVIVNNSAALTLDGFAKKTFDTEILADDLYNLCYKVPKKCGTTIKTKIIKAP